ncbi:hypothetical protein LINPERHAP1_LOCUS19815, partial [Linum perenne]
AARVKIRRTHTTPNFNVVQQGDLAYIHARARLEIVSFINQLKDQDYNKPCYPAAIPQLKKTPIHRSNLPHCYRE